MRRLEEELQRQRDRAARLAKELDDEKKGRTRAEVDLGMVRKSPDLAHARERIALLEEALRAAEEAVGVLQQRAVEAEKIIAQREAQIAALARELDALRIEASRCSQRSIPRLGRALAARAEAAEARAACSTPSSRSTRRRRGGIWRSSNGSFASARRPSPALEHELVRRERMVRELVGALEEIGGAEAAGAAGAAHAADSRRLRCSRGDARATSNAPAAENGELRAKLDALALEVARREGELQARAWRIAELEERVASLEARPAAAAERPAGGAGGGASVQAELNALRQALAQEHEARVGRRVGRGACPRASRPGAAGGPPRAARPRAGSARSRRARRTREARTGWTSSGRRPDLKVEIRAPSNLSVQEGAALAKPPRQHRH